MDLKKKSSIPLIPVLGVSIILILLIISAFVFQKNLIPPRVEASPATCTVDDNLKVNGWLQLKPINCNTSLPSCTTANAGMLIVCNEGGCPTCGGGSKCFIICDWDGNWNCVEDLQ